MTETSAAVRRSIRDHVRKHLATLRTLPRNARSAGSPSGQQRTSIERNRIMTDPSIPTDRAAP